MPDTISSNGKQHGTNDYSKTQSRPRTVVFFHPDLGIGGAERLVVDAAVGLQNRGHKVVIFTSHCDPGHCFDEARNGTLDVRVRGALLPATISGRFKILLTILRHVHLLLSTYLTDELPSLNADAFFVDQLSAGIPLMRTLYPDIRILFYCHFPDLLLVQGRTAWWKRIWRLPFDALEGWSMRGAERVVVNSKFTRGVVEGVWNGLGGEEGLGVVYPAVDTENEEDTKKQGNTEEKDKPNPLWTDKNLILSINRFERKKDIALAIRAFAALSPPARHSARLILAGGYDARVPENVSYHQDLVSAATHLGLSTTTASDLSTPPSAEVTFLLSVPAHIKTALLRNARLLVYTPTNEHFGIVPLEAMLAGVPVLATNTGGPLETVVEGQSGWLRDPGRVEQWTRVMHKVLVGLSDGDVSRMGEAGRERVRKEFSQRKMAARLDGEIEDMLGRERRGAWELFDLGVVLVAVVGFGLGVWGFFYTWMEAEGW